MKKSKTKFITIQIINGALIAGVFIFMMVVLITTKSLFFDYNDQSEFKFMVPIILITSLVFGPIIFRKQIQYIKKEDDLQLKLSKYQTATIIRAALFEGSALIGIMATFLTSNYYYLTFAGFAILKMVSVFPTKDKFTQNVGLSFEEKKQLNSL